MASPKAPELRRHYYSVRTGKRSAKAGFALPDFKRFVLACFERLETEGLFQEWMGYVCVDADFVPGKAGVDLDLFVFRKLRKQGLWPMQAQLANYDEDDVFDMIEFLFDHASKGMDGDYHSYNGCGWHYKTFEKAAGQEMWREAINDVLADYGSGYELSATGEILALGEPGLESLLTAPMPSVDPENVEVRVSTAILKFRRRGSSASDRRDAVRDLADVLEFLREEVKKVLKSDDASDLFNLANNFEIRHHRKGQKTDYDQSIWLSWMFYYYLATIHACVRLVEKGEVRATTPTAPTVSNRMKGAP